MESSPSYHDLFEGVPVGLFRISPDGRFLDANPALLEMLGYPDRGALLGRSADDFYADAAERRHVESVLDRERVVRQQEIRARRFDGTVLWVQLSMRAVPDGEGRRVLEGAAEDVTARKLAEEALWESEARLRVLVEQIPAILWLTDPDLRFTLGVGAGLQALGLAPNQIVGMSLQEYFGTQDPAFPSIAAHRRALQGEPVNYEAHWGSRIFQAFVKPARGADGAISGTVGVALDITERTEAEARLRETQERLRLSQRLEALGRLAGGVAHDFNNSLNVIMGFSGLLRARLTADDPVRRYADQIQKAVERSADLTRQLLAFSRRQILEPKHLQLNDLVVNLETMLRRVIGEDVELVTRLGEGLGHVYADPGQIEQVILNLALHARDSMPQGGRLTIETAEAQLDGSCGSSDGSMAPGPHVLLSVSDTGPGMDEQALAHVFEPFFGTGESGSGLGLATVYGVVRQSGGTVAADSAPGRGTRFRIYLPRVAPPPDAVAKPAAAPAAGTETILLVEDEDTLRDVVREALSDCGYTVLVAASGPDALDAALGHPGTIHLLLTDVVMPRMGGRELADRLRAQRAGLKVVYMTGYTDDAVLRGGDLEPGVALMLKPFTSEALTRKVREVLGTPGRGAR